MTPSNTQTPSNTITTTSTPTKSVTPTATKTPTQTKTPTNTPSSTVTPSNTQTPSNTITTTSTPTKSVTPTVTKTPTNTQTQTNTPTPGNYLPQDTIFLNGSTSSFGTGIYQYNFDINTVTKLAQFSTANYGSDVAVTTKYPTNYLWVSILPTGSAGFQRFTITSLLPLQVSSPINCPVNSATYTQSQGLANKDENTLIAVNLSGTSPYTVVEITNFQNNTQVTVTDKFKLPLNRIVSGDMLYTSTGKLILITQDSLLNKFYCTQYNYNDTNPTPSDFEISSRLTGLFEYNNKVYGMVSLGGITTRWEVTSGGLVNGVTVPMTSVAGAANDIFYNTFNF